MSEKMPVLMITVHPDIASEINDAPSVMANARSLRHASDSLHA